MIPRPNPDSMSRIFISYRREDSAWQAGRIYDRLADRFGREAIFKDVDAIKAGDNFQECINDAVGQCDVLLSVIGQKWLTVSDGQERRRLDNPADWVRLEIETALNRGDVRVIPILLDKVSMPAAQDLPVSLQPLCYRHAAYARQDPDFRRDIDYVLNVIEQHLEQSETAKRKQAAQILCESADAKWENKDFEGTISDCDQAIQLNPDYTEAYGRRGAAKSDLGDNQGAISDFDKALQLNPDYTKAYNNRGIAKRKLGDNQGAISDFDKALQLNPDYTKAYNNRGIAKRKLGDNQGAIADYDQAIQLNPGDADLYNNRGVAKRSLGDNQGAIADYDQAIQLNPDDANAYNNRGVAKRGLGDNQGAISDYQKAMALYNQQGNTDNYDLAAKNLKRIS